MSIKVEDWIRNTVGDQAHNTLVNWTQKAMSGAMNKVSQVLTDSIANNKNNQNGNNNNNVGGNGGSSSGGIPNFISLLSGANNFNPPVDDRLSSSASSLCCPIMFLISLPFVIYLSSVLKS